jgi:DNA ligase-1
MELMLAKNFDKDVHDPKGWYMSEKIDGVRCYWSGNEMYTRNGNIIHAPQWFKD